MPMCDKTATPFCTGLVALPSTARFRPASV